MKKYCEDCNKEVLYVIKQKALDYNIYGKEINIIGAVPLCKECGRELNDDRLSEVNVRRVRELYLKKHNIVSLDAFKRIVELVGEDLLCKELDIEPLLIKKLLKGKLMSTDISDKIRKYAADNKITIIEEEEDKETIKEFEKFISLMKENLGGDTHIETIFQEEDLNVLEKTLDLIRKLTK